MSKIKLRDKDIKLRGRETLATNVVRRMNIKALAKKAKPTAQEDQSAEAEAVDTGTETVLSTAHRVSGLRKRAARKAQKKHTANAAHNSAHETPEPPPVFSRILQKDHPDIPVHSPSSKAATPIQSAKAPSKTVTQKTPTPAQPRVDIKTASSVQPKQLHRSARTIGRKKAVSSPRTAQAIQKTKAAAAQAAAVKDVSRLEKLRTAVTSGAKLLAKALKELFTLLGSSSAGVLALLLVVILIGALLVSPMGIFFSSDSESDMTLQEVVGQLNREFSARITEIENTIPHDDLEQTGQRAKWKDILSVYAVKVSTDPENPLEVMTMDEERAVLLGEIFWEMNSIDYTTETYTEEITVEVPTEDSTDEDGMVAETQTIDRTRLLITISSITAQQMAEEYRFDQEQLSLMTELLSEEYEELWYGLPYGGSSDDIVEVALSQVGNVGGEPYWSWYGYSSRVAWCACFVSWCGEQCGYIESGAMPKFSYCPTGVQWFKNQGQWADRSVLPEPGWIVFFDWDLDGYSDHVGIVEYSDGSVVYTIEGNSNDACLQLAYSAGTQKIMGYGIISSSHMVKQSTKDCS